MPDALVDEMALVGPRERIADRLAAWRESGATTLLIPTRDAATLRTIAEAGRVNVRDLFDLSGRVAIVTGGGKGIGLQMATGLAEARRRPAPVRAQGGALRGRRRRSSPPRYDVRAIGMRCDVSDPARCRRWSTARVSELGRIDVLVNNAGTVWGGAGRGRPARGLAEGRRTST